VYYLSCTIIYKGKLKDNYDVQCILEIIKNHAKDIDCNITENKYSISLQFNQGKTEPLEFDFRDNKIDYFCKWNGNDESEFYKILDIFISIKPYFKSLKIEDDGGFWYIYNIMNKPCKIVRRKTLITSEVRLLERIKVNTVKVPNKIEKDIYKWVYQSEESGPYSYNIWRLIVQDVVKLNDTTELDKDAQTYLVNKGNNVMPGHFGAEDFSFNLMALIVAAWISDFTSYKNIGIVSCLDNNIRGISSSKKAAVWGIMSSFLNFHSGIVNAKHAEIDKFIVQQLSCRFYFILNELNDNGKTELELLVSILDYIGFKYNNHK